MTVKEALAHDWQVGEKLWEVYYKYNKDITTGKQEELSHWLFSLFSRKLHGPL